MNRLEAGTTDARGRRGFGAAGAQLHFDTTGKVRPGNRLTAARHNVGHARALEHAEVNIGPHILRHYVGAGAATLNLRGRAGGRHQRIELLAGKAIADNGIPVIGNFIGRVEPQLDELGGKQVGHARRPLDIADCSDGAAEHLERRATVGVGRMSTRALCLEHNVGITFLSQVGVHEPTLARAVLGSRNDAVVALVNQVLKLNAALLERAADGTCAVLRRLLVLAKGQEQCALVLPTVRQRILDSLENACDLVLHVDRAAAPDVGVVHVPAKGGVRPVGLGTRHNGDHVHVTHEHNGLKGRIAAGKCHQQRMVDKLDLARRKHAWPGLLHIGAQVVEGLPVHRLGIHARDGRKRQHAAQAIAHAGLVYIGKIVLMRKEAPNLGHDILSIVTTKAAPRERPCNVSVCVGYLSSR